MRHASKCGRPQSGTRPKPRIPFWVGRPVPFLARSLRRSQNKNPKTGNLVTGCNYSGFWVPFWEIARATPPSQNRPSFSQGINHFQKIPDCGGGHPQNFGKNFRSSQYRNEIMCHHITTKPQSRNDTHGTT